MRSASRFLLLLLTPALTFSQAARIDLEFSYDTNVDVAEEILQSLSDGHRSEIHYEARVYKKNVGISQLLGDRLIAEASVLYEVRWDELNERYIVVIDGAREIDFVGTDDDGLTTFLLSLANFSITLDDAPEGEIYLLCRAQIEPIRLVPPLTLMTFLLPKFRTTTPWTNIPFTRTTR